MPEIRVRMLLAQQVFTLFLAQKPLRTHDLGRDFHLLGPSAKPFIMISCFQAPRAL